MLHLRNINPMVRAVGTMGAVSALVGGITFAQLTSNTVALSPNTLSTGSANLEIGASSSNNHHYYSGNNNNTSDNTTNNTSSTTNNFSTLNNNENFNNNDNNNNTSSCRNTTNGTVPGFNLTGSNGLLPGVTSSPLNFCLKNTSDVPLSLTVAIPDNSFTNTTGIQASDVTLDITCDNGGSTTGTLDEYVGATTETLGSLAANGSTNCRATVELSNSATISGTESLPSFDIDFMGTTS